MSKNKLFVLLSVFVSFSIVLSACAGAASPAVTLDQTLARQATLVLANGSEESVFVSQTFSLPAGSWTLTRLIPTTATAEVLAQRALWVLTDQVLVPMFLALDIAVNPQADAVQTFAENPTFDNFLKTIGPNIVQQQAEGPQKLFLGDRLMIANADGSITTVQLANPDTVQELAEGKTDVNARSQCQETGQNCQTTPGPNKTRAMIEYLGGEFPGVINALYKLPGFDRYFGTCSDAVREPAYDMYVIFGDAIAERGYGPIGWCVDLMTKYPSSRFVFFTPDPTGSNPRQDLAQKTGVNFEHVEWNGISVPDMNLIP
jgi:hypothetical protein